MSLVPIDRERLSEPKVDQINAIIAQVLDFPNTAYSALYAFSKTHETFHLL